MDIFNLIFENYGGRKIEDFFKSMMILSLLLKQLVFSIFLTPIQQPNLSAPSIYDIPLYNQVEDQFTGESCDDAQILSSIIDLLEIKPKNTSARQEILQ